MNFTPLHPPVRTSHRLSESKVQRYSFLHHILYDIGYSIQFRPEKVNSLRPPQAELCANDFLNDLWQMQQTSVVTKLDFVLGRDKPAKDKEALTTHIGNSLLGNADAVFFRFGCHQIKEITFATTPTEGVFLCFIRSVTSQFLIWIWT